MNGVNYQHPGYIYKPPNVKCVWMCLCACVDRRMGWIIDEVVNRKGKALELSQWVHTHTELKSYCTTMCVCVRVWGVSYLVSDSLPAHLPVCLPVCLFACLPIQLGPTHCSRIKGKTNFYGAKRKEGDIYVGERNDTRAQRNLNPSRV